MSDLSKETLIKRKKNPVEQVEKYMLITGTVMMFALGFLGAPLFLGVGALMILACYFLLPRFDVEYEYIYYGGNLDIDKIMGRRKRKRMATLNMQKLIILAPSDSEELKRYKSDMGIRHFDFSSRYPDVKTWTMVVKGEDGQAIIKLEPEEKVIEDIRRIAPSKVVTGKQWY